MHAFLAFLYRCCYTPTVCCKTCGHEMYVPLIGEPQSLCGRCAELLSDHRSSTSSKVRVWPVETPKVRRIGVRRG